MKNSIKINLRQRLNVAIIEANERSTREHHASVDDIRAEFNALREAVEASPARSAWARGVKDYAVELLDDYCEIAEYSANADGVLPDFCKKILLNGASDWKSYSFGGCSLIYDADIAARLCTPSELRRLDGGSRQPNARELWPDIQARALSQTYGLIVSILKFFE